MLAQGRKVGNRVIPGRLKRWHGRLAREHAQDARGTYERKAATSPEAKNRNHCGGAESGPGIESQSFGGCLVRIMRASIDIH